MILGCDGVADAPRERKTIMEALRRARATVLRKVGGEGRRGGARGIRGSTERGGMAGSARGRIRFAHLPSGKGAGLAAVREAAPRSIRTLVEMEPSRRPTLSAKRPKMAMPTML